MSKEKKIKQLKKLSNELCELLGDKAENYGTAFEDSGKILKILAPAGVKPEAYQHILYVARVLDKLFRIMTGGPDNEEPFKDIAGYSLLEMRRQKEAASSLLNKKGLPEE
jgi:hypothetical protein